MGKKYAEVIKLRIASAYIGPSRGEILNKLVQESVVIIGLPDFFSSTFKAYIVLFISSHIKPVAEPATFSSHPLY